MLRFWGQPKFSREPLEPIGYELFLREYNTGNWEIPTDFSKFTATQITDLLTRTTPEFPQKMKHISINLDIDQFVDPVFLQAFFAIKQQLSGIHLSIELTERTGQLNISPSQLATAAKRFNDAGFYIILDDVSSGDNQLARVKLLNDFVHEYKFAIQNFRPFESLEDIVPNLTFWRDLAQKNQKLFTIEGVESKQDLLILSHYHADMFQGYALGRPVYLPTQDDPDSTVCESTTCY